MRLYESQTYTAPSWRFSGHPVVDVGGQEYAVNRQTHTIDKAALNKQLEQQQIAYLNAKAKGDKQAMEQAAKNGAELRKNGADLTVSPAAAALQKYYEQSGVKVAISSHSVADLNKGILQAKNDYAWAKAHNDQAGMSAAAQLGANLRAMGGTIGSDVSLVDAKNAVYGTPSKASQPTKSTSTQTESSVSKVGSFLGGVIYSVMNNTSNGALHTVANDDSLTGKSYVAGKVVGDYITSTVATTEVASGAAAFVIGVGGGAITSETGVGAVAGGALATEGAAQATFGAVTAGTSLSNLYHDTMSLAKSSNSGSTSGKIAGGDASKFEQQISSMSPNERVATVRTKLDKVAKDNGLVKDSRLSKINGRDVYRDPKSGDLYSIDTQHGRFEKTDSRGNHLGEYNIDMQLTKPADASGRHNLKVK